MEFSYFLSMFLLLEKKKRKIHDTTKKKLTHRNVKKKLCFKIAMLTKMNKKQQQQHK